MSLPDPLELEKRGRKMVGQFEFPIGGVPLPGEPKWEPAVIRREMATRVLAVARTRIEGAWTAYVDAVPGYDHGTEFHQVLSNGTKLTYAVASAHFPEFEGVPYAH